MEPILPYLASLTVRSLGLAAAALAAIFLFRMKTAAARHAVWTVVVLGMLLLAALGTLAPPVELRVLHSESVITANLVPPVAPAAASLPASAAKSHAWAWRWPAWRQAAAAIYLLIAAVLLARLAFGYLFMRRLLRASSRTELGPEAIHESTWISVPLTVGWARPRILLPAGWRDWRPDKLAAVLAHERTHVRRADWAIALLSGVNRCLFWFHPLAWWLERRLAALAEQACDDAALLQLESREPYAQALLDMAAAVKTGQGRLVWEAMAMARASEVRMRIERILDETRQIPRGLSARRWAVLAACSLPLIYLASVLQLAPALAQQPQEPRAAVPAGIFQLTPQDAARMEQQLAANPGDLQTRSDLIAYYFVHNQPAPRLTHILWLIQNHPESEVAAFNSAGLSPRPNPLNSAADYASAASAWRQQVAVHPTDPLVLANAAQFFGQPGGDWYQAESLLEQARSLPAPGGAFNATNKLAAFYSRVLNVSTDSSGAVHFPAVDENNAFASQVMAKLQSSTDGDLLFAVGNQLRASASPADAAAEHLMQPRIELGQQLLAKAEQLGVRVPRLMAMPPRVAGPNSTAPAVRPAQLSKPAQVVRRVVPVYPSQPGASGVSGEVQIYLTIGTDGRPTDIRVLHSLGMGFDESAIAAVKQWTFAPAQQNGTPVEAQMQVTVPFNPASAAPPPPAPQATYQTPLPPVPLRIRVGGNVQMAMLINKVDPVYPSQALTAGPDGGPLEGKVTLAVIIGKDGTVESVQPTEGHPLLAAAAADAVRQWVYKTTLLNGQPVEVSTTVTLSMTAK